MKNRYFRICLNELVTLGNTCIHVSDVRGIVAFAAGYGVSVEGGAIIGDGWQVLYNPNFVTPLI